MRHGTHNDPVRPKGAYKRGSRAKAKRSPVYLPVTTQQAWEAAQWLSAR